jgi:repressor LexA
MPESLTPLERRIYHYLIDFLTENTYQPSIREIGKKFRVKSTKTVSDLLQSLADKGYIERDPSRSRGVRLLGYSGVARTIPIPYYGKIHAGEPTLLPEYRQGYLTMDRRFVPNEESFFLKVKGDSMIGRGIHDGDFVMVDPTGGRDGKDGAIVAARLGEEATIKTLTYEGGMIVLEPANADDRAIVVKPDDDFAVLGAVCGVFRPMCDVKVKPEEAEPSDAGAESRNADAPGIRDQRTDLELRER